MRHLFDSPLGASPFNRGAPKNIVPAVGAALVTGGMNMLGGALNNIVNRSNMDYQVEQAKQLAKYQWDNFQSYPAQVRSMIKAGLNPSALLGQGGSGTTASPSINMPTSAPVDMGLSANSLADAIKTIAEAKKTGLEGVAQSLENEVLSATQKERIGKICQDFRFSAAQAEKTERECSRIEGLNTQLQQEIDLLKKQNVRFDMENDVFKQKLQKELRKYDDEHNLNYWQSQQIEQTLPTVLNKLKAEERILNVDADIQEDFRATQASLGVVGDVIKILMQVAKAFK